MCSEEHCKFVDLYKSAAACEAGWRKRLQWAVGAIWAVSSLWNLHSIGPVFITTVYNKSDQSQPLTVRFRMLAATTR